ncbi:MAG: SDR family NAD(P)-dependent oxidoreductase, partial [Actinobacteria bacterium]|nr:SDR family NAD(P)-dependent oxidoreductase [Actinomycetota bacterium]
MSSTTHPLSGKTAIVTGGGTLFGEAVARTLVADGATVLIVEINEETGAAAAKKSGDITDDAAIERIVSDAAKAWGHIDILVNLACTYDDAGADSTRAQWLNTLNVNVASTAMLGAAVRPHMAKQGGGSIVNLTSISSHVAQIGRWTYPVSKAAIVQLTKNMAMDYAPDKIRVNSVSPGWTWSAIMDMLS